MQGSYPKTLHDKDGKDKTVQNEVEHEQLEAKEPGRWAESPAHFDENGVRLEVEDTVIEDPADAGPASTGGEVVGYPKWLYHRDGKREQVVHSKEVHDALVDKDDWLEVKELSENLQSNSVTEKEHAGQSLWETPVRDVVEMLQGSSLSVLERTYAMEEKNPGGARRTLLRELSDLIEESQKAARLKAEAEKATGA